MRIFHLCQEHFFFDFSSKTTRFVGRRNESITKMPEIKEKNKQQTATEGKQLKVNGKRSASTKQNSDSHILHEWMKRMRRLSCPR